MRLIFLRVTPVFIFSLLVCSLDPAQAQQPAPAVMAAPAELPQAVAKSRCRCEDADHDKDLKDVMDKYDLVFEGKVRLISLYEGKPTRYVSVFDDNLWADVRTVTFQTTTTWKGADAPYMYVRSVNQDYACGVDFKVGEDYIVFASGPANNLRATACSKTRLAASGQRLAVELDVFTGRKPASALDEWAKTSVEQQQDKRLRRERGTKLESKAMEELKALDERDARELKAIEEQRRHVPAPEK